MQTVRVCHYKKLKINMKGEVFPCCLAPKHTYIGNIFDDNIVEKILNKNIICECQMYKSIQKTEEDKMDLNFIHYETSNVCQARCVCCPQDKEFEVNQKEHLERIKMLIKAFKPRNIVAIGGEILVQDYAFNMLKDLKNEYPDMKIHTISNLCVGEKRLKEAEEIFDEITVSMLGFTPLTYQNEMGLDFNKVIGNFEYLYNNKKVQLRPKYLMMPTNLFEIIPFFKWAVKLDVDKIYLHNIHEFKAVANLDNLYWKKTFANLEKQLKEVIEENAKIIKDKNRHFISIHPILAEMTHIDKIYLENSDIDKNVFIAN